MPRLDDGYSSIVILQRKPNIKLYEKDVTPPGVSMGGPIDTTTMRNTAWRTQAPRSLRTLSAAQMTVAYDPAVYDDIIAEVGKNQPIEVQFPDGTTVEFWGWIEEFTPGTLTEGEQPTANVVLQPSLRNAAGAEIAPVWNDANES